MKGRSIKGGHSRYVLESLIKDTAHLRSKLKSAAAWGTANANGGACWAAGAAEVEVMVPVSYRQVASAFSIQTS